MTELNWQALTVEGELEASQSQLSSCGDLRPWWWPGGIETLDPSDEEVATMKIAEAAERFLSHRKVAVTGVSRSAEDHGANVVYKRLRERGYQAYAVNPNATEVEGDRAYPDLSSIPEGVEAVVIGTAPSHAPAAIQECIDLGIKHVWFHRGPVAGSVNPEAAEHARAHGLKVIEGGCPCMFGPTSDTGHRIMRPLLQLTRKVPRRV